MAITKHVNDDPMANAGDTTMFAVATALFVAVTVLLYRPLFRRADQAAHSAVGSGG